MLRVTVELLPGGSEERKRTLAVLEIANEGTGTEEYGNYRGSLRAEYTGPRGRTGHVRQFRRRSQSVWSLIGAFLKLFGHTRHSPKLMEETQARGRL